MCQACTYSLGFKSRTVKAVVTVSLNQGCLGDLESEGSRRQASGLRNDRSFEFGTIRETFSRKSWI